MIINEEIVNGEQELELGWRKYWFVKNILTELPIIGGVFYTKNLSIALQHVSKSTLMLVGGGGGMYYGMISKSEDGMNMNENNIFLNLTEMAIGMSIGAVAYNGIYSAGKMCCHQYQKFISTKNEAIARATVQQEQEGVNVSVLSEQNSPIVERKQSPLHNKPFAKI